MVKPPWTCSKGQFYTYRLPNKTLWSSTYSPADGFCGALRKRTEAPTTCVSRSSLRVSRRRLGEWVPPPRSPLGGRSGARATCLRRLLERRLWSTSRVIFDSRRKPKYPYTPRIRFSSRVAVAARGTRVEMARAVFRSTPVSVRQLIEPTPTQDHWHALFRPRCSGFCVLRR